MSTVKKTGVGKIAAKSASNEAKAAGRTAVAKKAAASKPGGAASGREAGKPGQDKKDLARNAAAARAAGKPTAGNDRKSPAPKAVEVKSVEKKQVAEAHVKAKAADEKDMMVKAKAKTVPAAKVETTKANSLKAASDKAAAGKAPAVKSGATPAEAPKVAAKPVEAPKAAAKPVEAPKAAAKPVEAPKAAVKPAAAKAPAVKPVDVKPATQVRQGFKANEYIVYPAHGVGQIVRIEEQEVAGFKLELFVIVFAKDKMTLRVPTTKVASVGMRKLSDGPLVARALEVLKGRARIKRTMWSRRAQEYEAKINSGDLIAIAEVVRDLFRSEAQPEQSYSERQLYEAALDRMSREIAAVKKLTDPEAVKEIEANLLKGPRRAAKDEVEAEEVEDGETEAEAA